MKFYPADWFNDTMVLSAEARGCWINLISLMWNAEKRGEWTGTYEEFVRVTGTPWEKAPVLINELMKVATVTKRDSEVTLVCRRIAKDDLVWKNKLNRQQRYRERHMSDAKTTHKTLDVRLKTLDVRQRQLQEKKQRVCMFVKPSAQDVTAYSQSLGYRLDGSAFCDFYESKGWKVGNTPMRSWQAAVRTWKKNGSPKQKPAEPTKTGAQVKAEEAKRLEEIRQKP